MMAFDDIELRELRTRNKKETNALEKPSNFKARRFLEHYVKEDDSLPKLSLTYGCTVSELKQANSIYSEHEFHARKIMKIPVREHSILWEHSGIKADSVSINVEKGTQVRRSNSEGSLRKAREQLMYSTDAEYVQNGGSSTQVSYPHEEDYSSDEDLEGMTEKQSLLGGHAGVKTLNNPTNNVCEDYLDLVDRDIQHISKRVQSQTDIVGIGAHSLTYIQPDKTVCNNSEMLGQAGCFSYKGVVLFLCTISVVIPLLYLLYFLFLRKNDR